jgi:hypothetical protein
MFSGAFCFVVLFDVLSLYSTMDTGRYSMNEGNIENLKRERVSKYKGLSMPKTGSINAAIRTHEKRPLHL